MTYWVTWDVNDAISNAVGSFATAITMFFFLSPIKTFITIIKSRSTKAFRGEQFLFMFFNCSLWVFYGAYSGELEPLVCNAIGTFLAVIYIALYAYYLPQDKDTVQQEALINPVEIEQGGDSSPISKKKYLSVYFITLTLVVGVGIGVGFVDMEVADEDFSVFLLGIFANIFNLLMYGAPLGVMRRVIETKSVEYMPFLVSFFTLLCSTSWLMYGGYIGDLWITIPNASGFLLGIAQLVLYGIYYQKTPPPQLGSTNFSPSNKV